MKEQRSRETIPRIASQLKSFEKQARFYRIKNLIVLFCFITALSLLLIVIWGVLRFWIFALTINYNWILSVLTLFLAISTGFYAWVTYKMFREMEESRKSQVRPMLWVHLDRPEFKEESDTRLFSNKIKIANYGRGPAVDISVSLTITEKDNYIISTLKEGIPAYFSPGSSYEDTVRIYTRLYDLREHKAAFLRVDALYEDVERNLYSLIQFYDLDIFKIEGRIFYYWNLKREDLYFYGFSMRSYVGDRNAVLKGVPPQKRFLEGWKAKLIFRRK